MHWSVGHVRRIAVKLRQQAIRECLRHHTELLRGSPHELLHSQRLVCPPFSPSHHSSSVCEASLLVCSFVKAQKFQPLSAKVEIRRRFVTVQRSWRQAMTGRDYVTAGLSWYWGCLGCLCLKLTTTSTGWRRVRIHSNDPRASTLQAIKMRNPITLVKISTTWPTWRLLLPRRAQAYEDQGLVSSWSAHLKVFYLVRKLQMSPCFSYSVADTSMNILTLCNICKSCLLFVFCCRRIQAVLKYTILHDSKVGMF